MGRTRRTSGRGPNEADEDWTGPWADWTNRRTRVDGAKWTDRWIRAKQGGLGEQPNEGGQGRMDG